MVNGLTSCTEVKHTPSDIKILSIQNPTGKNPKLVHVKCEHDSAAYISAGWIMEAWYSQNCGMLFTTNGSTGANASYYLSPVQQTPTKFNTYYLNKNTIELYKGNGSITSRWNTSTEYTVEIYTDENTTNIGGNLRTA